MTDKELKKLSKLELLELLLTETRENSRLKEELEDALEKVSLMMDNLCKAEEGCDCKKDFSAAAPSDEAVSVNSVTADINRIQEESTGSADEFVDFNIYKMLIFHYIRNPEALDNLPAELRSTVTNRIDELKRKY